MSFNDEEMEIAIYGLKRLGMFAASLIVAFLIGMLMDNVKGVFLFLLFFIPLRIFAGGLHLPTLWMCAVASSLLIAAVALILDSAEGVLIHGRICTAVLLAGAFVIMMLAPVDTVNKTLFQEEKVRYKIISIAITVAEAAIFFISQGNNFIKLLIFLVIMVEAFYLTVQKIVNCVIAKRSKGEQ